MSHKIVTNLMQFIWMQIAKYFTLSNTNLFVFFIFWSIAPSSCPNSELTIHWLARLWAFPPYWQSPLCKSNFFFFNWRPTLPKRMDYSQSINWPSQLQSWNGSTGYWQFQTRVGWRYSTTAVLYLTLHKCRKHMGIHVFLTDNCLAPKGA